MRILVIENETEDRLAIKNLLQTQFKIMDFEKVSHAVSYVGNNPIDVALIKDYLIANIDGVKILSQLKEKSKSEFKAIALIEYSSVLQTNHLLEAGFHGVLCKPVNLDKFIDLI